jgi:hypothetical protein
LKGGRLIPALGLAESGALDSFELMSTLAEIENAVPQLGVEELGELERFVRSVRLVRTKQRKPSALDLPPLRLGTMLKPLSAEDDLLEEMLNDARD